MFRNSTEPPHKVLISHQKVLKKSSESPQKVLRKSSESPQKVLRKSSENHQKIIRKSSENHQKVIRKSSDHPSSSLSRERRDNLSIFKCQSNIRTVANVTTTNQPSEQPRKKRAFQVFQSVVFHLVKPGVWQKSHSELDLN